MDKLNANETIELTDLEPTGEVTGGHGIGHGAANLVSFDTTTPGTSSGTSRPGSVFTVTFGGSLL